MKRHLWWFVFIVILTIFAGWVSLPSTEGAQVQIDSDGNGQPDIVFAPHQSLGLDIVGGLRVLLQAELPPGSFTVQDLQTAANNVSKRVNALGVTEPTVQVQGSSRILVELPGETDPDAAIKTIQQTALLEFVDFSGMSSRVSSFEGHHILTTEQQIMQQNREAAAAANAAQATAEATSATGGGAAATAEATSAAASIAATAEAGPAVVPTEQPMANPDTGQPFPTIMTGSGLQSAVAQLNGTQWTIRFELTDQGSQVFGPFTSAHIGQPMAIVLDGVVLSAPVIRDALPTGGTISGSFNEASAKQLALQLRSGSLPIPLRVESAETVGATLGQQSVRESIRAGILGVTIVLLFMLVYYRVPGIAADLALGVFILLNMAAFKIIPVTLTLPAITGFLVSIGTAVDGNVLIFERIKEELHDGSPLEVAIPEGFRRAWPTIRDSNLSTIIICGVLFLFGQTPGASIVAGFAVTLALGLILNLFTAVIVTRTFLNLMVDLFRNPLTARRWLLGATR